MKFNIVEVGQRFRSEDDPNNIFMKVNEIEDDYGFIDNAVVVSGKKIGFARCFGNNDKVFVI